MLRVLQKDRVNLKTNSSVFFMGFIFIMMAGLIFFLSSSFIFKEKMPVLNTDINVDQAVSGNGKLNIYSWIYDKEKNEMEITLVTKNIDTIENKILFEAFQRNGNPENLQVKNVYSEDGIYVINVYGLTNNFQQVALGVIEETENQLADDKGANNETKEILATLYSDQRKVKQGEIKVRTENENAAYLSDVLLNDVNIQLKENKNEIENEKKKQQQLQSEINNNDEKMIYETEEEKVETESIIHGYKMRIDDSNQTIKDIEARNNLLQEKKSKLEQRKMELEM
jgi:hypothetical protein